MGGSGRQELVRICREVLAPLVRADGGEMYLARVEGDEVHIHLAGTCAGCPGAGLTRDRILEPALRALAPKLRLVVTTGWKVPEGAERIDPAA